jgi:hypothetical protein
MRHILLACVCVLLCPSPAPGKLVGVTSDDASKSHAEVRRTSGGPSARPGTGGSPSDNSTASRAPPTAG